MNRHGQFRNIIKSIQLTDGYANKDPLIVAIHDYFYYLNDFLTDKNDQKTSKKFIHRGFFNKIPQLDEIFVNDDGRTCLEILNYLLKYHEEIQDYKKCDLIKYIIDLYYEMLDEIKVLKDGV